MSGGGLDMWVWGRSLVWLGHGGHEDFCTGHVEGCVDILDRD